MEAAPCRRTPFDIEELVKLRPLLVRHAERFVPRTDIAEDVVQDVLVRMWERRIQFDPERGSLRGWLFVVTRNAAIDATRREAVHTRNSLLAIGLSSTPPIPEDSIDQLDRESEVRTRLSVLPEAQRKAIELTYFSDLTHTLVAARLNEPLGTVKSRIRRGMLAMAEV